MGMITEMEMPSHLTSMLNSNCPIVVSFSGGKDSIAMVLYLLDMGFSKDRIHLHHHLVDGKEGNVWDWPCTDSYCIAFAEAMGLKIFMSYRHGGITREIHRKNEGLQPVFYQAEPDGPFIKLESNIGNSTRGKFPAVSASLATRWCSAVVKIDVMSRMIPRLYPTGDLIVCTGERRQESTNRAKYDNLEWHRCNSQKRPTIQWRPVLEWTEEQVWAIMEKYRIQPHPCYELGWSRCSCMRCIFNGPDVWASIAEIEDIKTSNIARMETELGFTLYKGQTIAERAAKGTSIMPEDAKERWLHESQTEFVSPIIVDHWKLPAGAYKGGSCGSV